MCVLYRYTHILNDLTDLEPCSPAEKLQIVAKLRLIPTGWFSTLNLQTLQTKSDLGFLNPPIVVYRPMFVVVYCMHGVSVDAYSL